MDKAEQLRQNLAAIEDARKARQEKESHADTVKRLQARIAELQKELANLK